jgi:hypothetical protein
MTKKNSINDQSQPKAYDVSSLLNFSGPSTRRYETMTHGLPLIGFRSTDRNEINIARLLSSQAIPFYLRQEKGWGETERQMLLVVATDRQQEAMAVLKAAADMGALDLAEGLDGLISY